MSKKSNPHQPLKDIRVDMKFKNNLILARMEMMGLKTVSELSRATGIDNGTLGRFVNMKAIPFTKKDVWRGTVLKLSDFFKCLPEELFSELQQENALEENRTHVEMHFCEVQAMLIAQNAPLLEPPAVAEVHELNAILEQALSSLDPRSQEILRARFGLDGPEMTLQEVGEKFGVSRARIGQIERKALRQMRNPSRSKLLREAAGIGD